MSTPDETKSAAFIAAIQFGPQTDEDRNAAIQELYPDKKPTEVAALREELKSTEYKALAVADPLFQEKGPESDPEMYAALGEAFPWMTQSAMDYIVFRVHYYDFHG